MNYNSHEPLASVSVNISPEFSQKKWIFVVFFLLFSLRMLLLVFSKVNNSNSSFLLCLLGSEKAFWKSVEGLWEQIVSDIELTYVYLLVSKTGNFNTFVLGAGRFLN